MLGIALSLLSGAVVAATPITPQPWFNFTEDFPMKAFERKLEGVTDFELLIAPDGSIAKCTVTKSSGEQMFDKQTCFLATKRARFRPARGPEGGAAFGVYRGQAVWALPEHKINASPGPDLEVSLNKMPQGVNEPPAVKLAYAVDAQGNVSSCTLMPTSLKQPSQLVELGCKELLSRENGKPVLGPSGQPVAAVKTGAVRFKAGR